MLVVCVTVCVPSGAASHKSCWLQSSGFFRRESSHPWCAGSPRGESRRPSSATDTSLRNQSAGASNSAPLRWSDACGWGRLHLSSPRDHLWSWYRVDTLDCNSSLLYSIELAQVLAYRPFVATTSSSLLLPSLFSHVPIMASEAPLQYTSAVSIKLPPSSTYLTKKLEVWYTDGIRSKLAATQQQDESAQGCSTCPEFDGSAPQNNLLVCR